MQLQNISFTKYTPPYQICIFNKESLYGVPTDVDFVERFPRDRRGFLGQIVPYQESFCVGTQLASSARPQRAAGLISNTKTLKCSTLSCRFRYHNRTTSIVRPDWNKAMRSSL